MSDVTATGWVNLALSAILVGYFVTRWWHRRHRSSPDTIKQPMQRQEQQS